MRGFRTILVSCFAAVIAASFSCDDSNAPAMPYDQAVQELSGAVRNVNAQEALDYQISDMDFQDNVNVGDTLPDINTFDLPVYAEEESDVVAPEIFTSTEKSGSGNDGWMVEVANRFNDKGYRLKNGKLAKVTVRKIASGTGYEFIAYDKYLPDAFSPSSDLWIRMVEAAGVRTDKISDSLVENVAGIVMKDEVYKDLETQYKEVSVKTVTDMVIQKKLFLGYTNPFASSTGLNFLYTVLATFAGNDESKMLQPETVSAFQEFQKGVPFVALTTIQMRDSVQRGGSLQAFVMEWQTFNNTDSLKSGYKFIPFGYLHNNPLYAVGGISDEKREALQLFATFATTSGEAKELKSRFGFDNGLNYQPALPPPDGATLISAQKLWKREKSAGKPILAVFIGDTSGSMGGERIRNLKKALLAGSKFIDPKNYIGLISFDTSVVKLLEIDQFNDLQKAKFMAAVENLEANGQTAMYDAIVYGAQMLVDAKAKVPDSKPQLFVLTDGETNAGFYEDLGALRGILAGLRIPIYTISYGESISGLQALSSINEAASLNAQEDDISYQIGALLNAQM